MSHPAAHYQWRLRALMAERGMFSTTEIRPLLAERGISLSVAQVYRLVAGTPERLNLDVLAALCDILGCTPNDLIEVRSKEAAAPKRRQAQAGRRAPAVEPTRADSQERAWVSPRACGVCGRVGRIRKRATENEPDVCDRCWRGPTLCCSNCGASRRCPNGRRSQRPLCVFCLAALDAADGRQSRRTRRCADCNKLGPRIGRRCPPCSVERRLVELIDNSPVANQLGALRRALQASEPRRLLRWLAEGGEERLRPLLTGEVEVSHDGLDELPASKSTEWLRDLLVARGALEPVQRHARVFERWAREQLQQITDPADHRIVHEFATWRLLHDLRRRGRGSELTYSALTLAKTRLRLASELLGWARERGLRLVELRQGEIDEWVTSGPSTRREIEIFVNWTTSKRYSVKLVVPRHRGRSMPPELPAEQRWALARRLLNDETLDVADRVAGLLILFYGQPLSRVLALKRSTVKLDHDHGVWNKLGRHPTRLRPPLSKLVLELANRPTTGVVSNGADSDWLFVGQRPGRPLSEVRMSVRLRALGFPLRAARSTTLLHLEARVPAPILADLLGIHPNTANEWVSVAGGRWSSYAAPRSDRSATA